MTKKLLHLKDLIIRDFHRYGDEVIATVRDKKPESYLGLVDKLLSRENSAQEHASEEELSHELNRFLSFASAQSRVWHLRKAKRISKRTTKA